MISFTGLAAHPMWQEPPTTVTILVSREAPLPLGFVIPPDDGTAGDPVEGPLHGWSSIRVECWLLPAMEAAVFHSRQPCLQEGHRCRSLAPVFVLPWAASHVSCSLVLILASSGGEVPLVARYGSHGLVLVCVAGIPGVEAMFCTSDSPTLRKVTHGSQK